MSHGQQHYAYFSFDAAVLFKLCLHVPAFWKLRACLTRAALIVLIPASIAEWVMPTSIAGCWGSNDG